MDWPGLGKFLSDTLPFLLYALYFLILIRGGVLLDFLRRLYEARQDRLIAEAESRVRVAELELEKERDRNRPKFNHPLDVSQDQPYPPYQEGIRQELPPQQY